MSLLSFRKLHSNRARVCEKLKKCRFVRVCTYFREQSPPHQTLQLHLSDDAFADAALGALGTAHGSAEAAALLAGGAFAGAGTSAGATSGAGAVEVRFDQRGGLWSKAREEEALLLVQCVVEPICYSWEISQSSRFSACLAKWEDLAALGTHSPKVVAIQAEKQLPPLDTHSASTPQPSSFTQWLHGFTPSLFLICKTCRLL